MLWGDESSLIAVYMTLRADTPGANMMYGIVYGLHVKLLTCEHTCINLIRADSWHFISYVFEKFIIPIFHVCA